MLLFLYLNKLRPLLLGRTIMEMSYDIVGVVESYI